MTPRQRPLVVVAVGGNALLQRGERLDIVAERANVALAAAALAELAGAADLAVVHGNGPQVGLLALESEAGPAPMPLDVLDAESQGQIGYLLVIGLGNALPDRPVVALLTHVEVDADDPAFARPTKPIGPTYTATVAQGLAAARGWEVRPDSPAGDLWRRVVASPEPRAVVELDVIAQLLARGVVVVCAGGGGIPVVTDGSGRRRGVEAVVDKDLTAAALAIALDADGLVLLTDVEAVYRQWGTAAATAIRELPASEATKLELPPGSMGPKVEAARRFAAATGRAASIGSLRDAVAVAAGHAGTIVGPDRGPDAGAPPG
jgi:carbamate kinase